MLKNRIETWFTLAVAAVGVVFAAVLGLWVFVSATAKPLHPADQDVPSVVRSAPSSRWAEAVDRGREVVRTSLRERNLPGLSVAVGVDGTIVWAEGFGWADLDARTPVAPETRFRIGSASVALTSAAVGVLLEQGRLSLDDEIRTHVPDFPRREWPVTVRQVMGHVAGVRSDGGDEGPLFTTPCERPVDALEVIGEGALLFEPGTQYRFSNYGWILVSAAIEAAAKEPFLRFMRKQVFEPLGMDDTLADSTTETIADRATPYFPRFAADPRYGPDPMRELDYSCYAGASAFLSTPTDLVRFAMGINGGALLQPTTVALLQTSLRLPSRAETGYGLGWDLETVTLAGTQTRLIGHDGDVLGGRAASLMTFPEHGIVVAVTANISYADTFALGLSIADAFAQTRMATRRMVHAPRARVNDAG